MIILSVNREAIDTIKGYYYQFDYSILQLLQADEKTQIHIEGIEDIDITNIDMKTAIQCKYYAGTAYNHSVIGKPLRSMLKHFSKNKYLNLRYKIYGYYSKGQEKLPNDIDIEFAKKKFFSYSKNSEKIELHKTLKLNDEEIEMFLSKLTIDIHAMEFDIQNKYILEEFSRQLNCSSKESEHFYNNSLRFIRNIAVKRNREDRVIFKSDFLNQINNKNELFNLWYLGNRGIESYCQKIKSLYFSEINLSPFSRFFLIESNSLATQVEIKSILIKLSKRMSKLSKREANPFCPYVYLYNIDDEKLLNVKKRLQNDGIDFLDGHDFKDADFNCKSICKKPNYNNQIQMKIINNLENLEEILLELDNTREIYQFYFNAPFYSNDEHKHIVLPITSINDLSQIIG